MARKQDDPETRKAETRPDDPDPRTAFPPDTEDGRTLRPTSVSEDETVDAALPYDANSPAAKEEGVDPSHLVFDPSVDQPWNATYCYALVRDTDAGYVFWEIGEPTRRTLTEKYGEDFFEKNSLIMLMHDVTGVAASDGTGAVSTFEIDDDLHWKTDYWVTVDPGREYVFVLGYRAHGSLYFEHMATSNRIQTPRAAPTGGEHFNRGAAVEVQDHTYALPVSPEDWRFNQYHYWRNHTHIAPEEQGYWALVLHQHLPYIRHPQYDVALEEQWFFEAVVSVYTRLIALFWELEREKIDFRVTLSLTPPLMSMMRDELLQQRCRRHIDECIRLAEREYVHVSGKPWRTTLEQILTRLHTSREVFDAYDGDLTRGYRDFQNLGKVEVITCAATHALLPFYLHYPEAIRAQIQTACSQYERAFGRWPQGIWLPEHAFAPGVDEILAEQGIRWFLSPSHGMMNGDTRCHYGTARPVITPAGTAAFGIDDETRSQVWSRDHGYPGDPRYKEWYRDLGYDMEWDHLPEYWKTADVRRNTGLKYYRITGRDADLGEKAYYHPEWAREAVGEHAGQFVHLRTLQTMHLRERYDTKPVIVSAYDAELFGHWWEEGPDWLGTVFRRLLYDQAVVRPCTPSEFLVENREHQQLMPNVSSWGDGKTFGVWLDGREYQPNCWIYRHLFRLVDRMADAATRHPDAVGKRARALNQAAREIFLAMSSDWAFLIHTGQAVRYSEMRTTRHIDRAKNLLAMVERDDYDDSYLQSIEYGDNIFPFDEMDYRRFCRSG